jgi:hypothetical protein
MVPPEVMDLKIEMLSGLLLLLLLLRVIARYFLMRSRLPFVWHCIHSCSVMLMGASSAPK